MIFFILLLLLQFTTIRTDVFALVTTFSRLDVFSNSSIFRKYILITNTWVSDISHLLGLTLLFFVGRSIIRLKDPVHTSNLYENDKICD